MIGNDIIDIKLARSQQKWQHSGYLKKLFTVQEQAAIVNAQDPFNQICLFWSLKESAYKITIQQGDQPRYAPKSLSCTMLNEHEGQVVYKDKIYYTYSTVNQDIIYTRALLFKKALSISQFFRLSNSCYKDQSRLVHQKLKRHFSSEFNFYSKDLELLKNKSGVPSFYKGQEQIKRSISITHHGNFGAYAFSI